MGAKELSEHAGPGFCTDQRLLDVQRKCLRLPWINCVQHLVEGLCQELKFSSLWIKNKKGVR